MSTTPVRMSNEEFMEGGPLYPGGTGIVKKFSFELWGYGDVNNKDFVAAAMLFQPTDGSNEGKEIMLHWSCGKAEDYSPDGSADNGYLAPLKGQQKMGSSNYAYFITKLKETCGMPNGTLLGPRGIRVLEGTSLTLARVDQPKREGLDDGPPADPSKKQRTKQTYIPTRAQWGWETGAQPAIAGAGAAPGVRTARRGATAAPAPAPAPAPVNGTANGTASSVTADSIIEALLAAGPVNIADLPRLSLEWLTANNITDRQIRLPLSKAMKDAAAVEEMAVVNDWKLENGVLSI